MRAAPGALQTNPTKKEEIKKMRDDKKDKAGLLDDNHIKSALIKAVEKIDAIYTASTPYLGLTTGFNEFDELTGGLYPANLIVLAGRPGMGKTTLAMNIIEHTAIKLKKTALLFSLETVPEIAALKFICSMGRIDAHRFKTGKINDDDWPRVSASVDKLSKAPIYIMHNIGENIEKLCATAYDIALKAGDMGLIVIDYLQLLCHCTSSMENRTLELTAIMRHLKQLAQDLNVPIIAISQLHQPIEQPANQRPLIADLSALETVITQDADMICFIHRDDYYHESAESSYVAELIIAKHRNGPTGIIKTAYLDECGRFENLCFPELSTE